eukprot:GHVT01015769.1.p1 GENE.GHVT01015769.1~~GHVT01015769.1.p1  ORF type:complete len:146 (-),score=14.87 GHVT01015769.1:1831-2268(-)
MDVRTPRAQRATAGESGEECGLLQGEVKEDGIITPPSSHFDNGRCVHQWTNEKRAPHCMSSFHYPAPKSTYINDRCMYTGGAPHNLKSHATCRPILPVNGAAQSDDDAAPMSFVRVVDDSANGVRTPMSSSTCPSPSCSASSLTL